MMLGGCGGGVGLGTGSVGVAIGAVFCSNCFNQISIWEHVSVLYHAVVAEGWGLRGRIIVW
eukprot:10795387-Lingulodinium_polyedra.AAC.1